MTLFKNWKKPAWLCRLSEEPNPHNADRQGSLLGFLKSTASCTEYDHLKNILLHQMETRIREGDYHFYWIEHLERSLGLLDWKSRIHRSALDRIDYDVEYHGYNYKSHILQPAQAVGRSGGASYWSRLALFQASTLFHRLQRIDEEEIKLKPWFWKPEDL